MKSIPYGRQQITDEDIEAVVKTLKSDFLTQGPKIKEFENAFADYIGAKYAVAVANGTAALHLSALALRIDETVNVITTPITFAATANCVKFCGGNVFFADIEKDTFCLSLKKVEELINSRPKGFFKGIIPVDFAGYALDLKAFNKLAKEHGLWIIEDACHAPGGFFVDTNGDKSFCGACNYSDLAMFSFHPVKHIACGEGGMITTNDENLYKRILSLRTHGITKDGDLFKNTLEFANGVDSDISEFPGWYMEMQELGFNYRLTDFQAALGLSQLKRADDNIKKRREIAKAYFEAFKDLPYIKRQSGAIEGHAYHLYIVEVENRLGLYNYLRTKNIFTQIHYIPLHLMPYYRQFGWKPGDMPVAEEYYKNCISLPMYPSLTKEEQNFVIQQIKAFYHE